MRVNINIKEKAISEKVYEEAILQYSRGSCYQNRAKNSLLDQSSTYLNHLWAAVVSNYFVNAITFEECTITITK